jgi:hypothetical protein
MNFSRQTKDTTNAIINGTILIGSFIPTINTIIASVDRILRAIQKAKHGRAICEFIAKNVENTKKILFEKKECQVDESSLERFITVLAKIETYVDSVRRKKPFDLWKSMKQIASADEVNLIRIRNF